MTLITKNTIEDFAIELMERFGCQYIYGQIENKKLITGNYER